MALEKLSLDPTPYVPDLDPILRDSIELNNRKLEYYINSIGIAGSGALIPAANITAGIFQAGMYTFPGGLQVPWLEVRNTGGDAFIDFTRTPGTVDFDVRLINEAADTLALRGGQLLLADGLRVYRPGSANANLYIGSGTGSALDIQGYIDFHQGDTSADEALDYDARLFLYDDNFFVLTGANFKVEGYVEVTDTVYASNWFRSYGNTGWYNQTHGRGVFCDDAYVKVYGGAEFWAPSNKIRAEMARFGQCGPWADHVCYSHNNYQQDGQCGFMQRWDGAAWWRSNGQLGFTSSGSDIAWMASSGGWCDFRPNLPSLGGDMMVIAGSNQIGRTNSSIRYKDRIGNLLGTEESAIWKFQPVRFLWKENDSTHETRVEINRRNPGGIAGFIAEEVAELAPDAVTYGLDGLPSSLETWTLLAYVVAGLQYLKGRVDALEGA